MLPLIVSLISIGVKEYKYQITIKVAKKTNSSSLRADAVSYTHLDVYKRQVEYNFATKKINKGTSNEKGSFEEMCIRESRRALL